MRLRSTKVDTRGHGVRPLNRTGSHDEGSKQRRCYLGAVGACLQDKQRDPDPLDIGDTLIPDPGPQSSDDADVPGNLGPADDLWDLPELNAPPVPEQSLPHWQRSPEETKLLELIALYRTMFPPLLLDELQPVLPAPRSLYYRPHFYN
ncbi:hypothetical protein DFH09DRAFT_1092299 [Mycena vulgaris]|nr:hypothetical protein DFH09DRAFT_1092299 [Mycena vulgaris]